MSSRSYASRGEIPVSMLYEHLVRGRRYHEMAELIVYLRENAGVLVSPGQDTEQDVSSAAIPASNGMITQFLNKIVI